MVQTSHCTKAQTPPFESRTTLMFLICVCSERWSNSKRVSSPWSILDGRLERPSVPARHKGKVVADLPTKTLASWGSLSSCGFIVKLVSDGSLGCIAGNICEGKESRSAPQSGAGELEGLGDRVCRGAYSSIEITNGVVGISQTWNNREY